MASPLPPLPTPTTVSQSGFWAIDHGRTALKMNATHPLEMGQKREPTVLPWFATYIFASPEFFFVYQYPHTIAVGFKRIEVYNRCWNINLFPVENGMSKTFALIANS